MSVRVGRFVGVRVSVAVRVGVLVGPVGVLVGVGVTVGVGVLVRVGVAVCVGRISDLSSGSSYAITSFMCSPAAAVPNIRFEVNLV